MNELIKITQTEDGKTAVSARELYSFLSIDNGSNFAKWAKLNIEDFFTQNTDYQILRLKDDKSKGRPSIDYALTMDAAKEVAMMSRCENGKIARQYFIECERKLVQISKPLSQYEVLVQSAQLLLEQNKRMDAIETKVTELEAKSTTLPDYFAVAGYAATKKMMVTRSMASLLGAKAARICKKEGIPIDQCPDPRFGKVNLYPRKVLETVFKEAF
ncbi:MAG: antA/AntB antirepressor family protein [Veillonellales bacterium]